MLYVFVFRGIQEFLSGRIFYFFHHAVSPFPLLSPFCIFLFILFLYSPIIHRIIDKKANSLLLFSQSFGSIECSVLHKNKIMLIDKGARANGFFQLDFFVSIFTGLCFTVFCTALHIL